MQSRQRAGRNCTHATLEQGIAQIDERVEGYLKELEAADAQDGAGPPGGARAAELQTKLAALRERRLRYADLLATLERRGQAQLSLTDPASRARQGGHGGGSAVCSKVQTAVAVQPTRIVAGDVTNAPTNRDGRSPLAVEAQESLGGPFDTGADGGYSQGQAVKQCLQAGIPP